MPKISVIVPVFNAECFLERCICSLQKQTYSDFEAIFIDDGSFDKSAEIFQYRVASDQRFLYFYQEHQGQSVARNHGIEQANGEYIIFCDADDFLPSNALDVFIGVASGSKADVVVSDKMFFNKQNKEKKFSSVKWKKHNSAFKDFVNNKYIFSSVCNKLYKTEILKRHRFIENIFFEDWCFVTMLFGSIKSFVSVSIPLYCYDTGHPSTIRSSFDEKKLLSYIIGIRQVFEFFNCSENQNLVRKRLNIALKMCVGQVYKAHRQSLRNILAVEVKRLFQEKIIILSELSLKTRYRLWKMKIINLKDFL